MGAALLIIMLLLLVANLVLTLRIMKGVVAMGAKVEVPRGVPRGMMSEVERIDYGKLAEEVAKAVNVDAEESGEEETELSQEQIAEITAAVFKNIGKQ